MPRSQAAAFAPGRVNLIGEHTDYNYGLALPFATTTGVTVQAEALGSRRRIEAHALDLGEHDSFELGAAERAPGWRAFVRGAAEELLRAGFELPGARLRISGDVPRGGGLSSSAALELALCLALIALAGARQPDDVELARLCSSIEHQWVGARSGLLDQLASLWGRREHAVRIDFRSLAHSHVALELDGHQLVTLDSGERHSHAASGYNQRRDECARAAELLGVGTLRDAELDTARSLPPPLDARVIHVITENERVDQVVAALQARDWRQVGALLGAGHASLRDLYEVSTPAIEEAVGRLKQAGALGARLIGGGFGGHVLGLLPPGIEPPEGAIRVQPGAGARLL